MMNAGGKPTWVLLIGALALLAATAAPAQIYKFTDENGIVHYTNVKPAGVHDLRTFNFPCYASDPTCRQVDWEHVQLDTRTFDSEIRTAAEAFAVEPSLIRAIIHAESAYRPDAKSPKGAQGLMQLMPATQRDLAVDDPYEPLTNIYGGTDYLSQLLATFDGDVDLATAAYNAGPEAVRRHRGIPPYAETQEYVRRVKILHRRYREAGA
jgi:soluble lytic murein transglycosylase-like protein